MKWVNTQQWIDTSNELYAIAIKYCILSSRLHKVSIKDRETTYKLLCSMNPNGVAEEMQ